MPHSNAKIERSNTLVSHPVFFNNYVAKDNSDLTQQPQDKVVGGTTQEGSGSRTGSGQSKRS